MMRSATRRLRDLFDAEDPPTALSPDQKTRMRQLIQAMLSDSYAEIYAAQCMMRDAIAKADSGAKILKEAAAFKMFASEMCGRVADRCVQIHGGAGYVSEYAIERFYRDVRLFRLYEGTTQIHQLNIAKITLRRAAQAKEALAEKAQAKDSVGTTAARAA